MNYILVNYILMFVVGLLIPVYFFGSLMISWFKVKTSGGSKVLIHVLNPLADYWRAGTFDNGHFQFRARKRKDNPSPNRMISINTHSEATRGLKYDFQQVTYNLLGVRCVDIDDIKNCVMVRNNGSYESVTGFNAEAVDETVKTALMKPSLQGGLFDPKMWQIIQLVLFFIVVVGIILIYRALGTHDAHLQIVYNYLQNKTIVG